MICASTIGDHDVARTEMQKGVGEEETQRQGEGTSDGRQK